MFEKIKLKMENKLNIVDDKTDNLTKMVQIKIKKTVRV